jgi:hypothetical protein
MSAESAEEKWIMITIAGECAAQWSAQSLVDLIWSGAEWNPVCFGIKGVAIEYDDGQHQSVYVCVEWQRRNLTLSIRRFRDSASRISFFYTQPPPSVLRQTGIWEAHVAGDVCYLSLVRKLELKQYDNESNDSFRSREQAFGALLQAHLDRTLEVVVRPAECGLPAIRTMRPARARLSS